MVVVVDFDSVCVVPADTSIKVLLVVVVVAMVQLTVVVSFETRYR